MKNGANLRFRRNGWDIQDLQAQYPFGEHLEIHFGFLPVDLKDDLFPA
jgi:hypothetical protein